MNSLLIIDDDQQLGLSFAKILSQEGYTPRNAFTGREGIESVKKSRPDLVILDIRLPDMGGLEVFDEIHSLFPKLPVIIITAYSTTETAIGAINKGAFDYIYKPFDVPEMLAVIEKAMVAGRCMSSPVDVNPDGNRFSDREALIGNCSSMLELYKAIGRVSATDATVLIRGESGTGKELVSRAIYNHSSRADKPFVVINCVAIPETLLESELFGYEKGSFTGAVHRRVGKIEQARGGTIFLDEIGDMPLSIQSKFLRLLQENNIERLGGKEPIDVDVRIIAATNRNLETAVAEGTFREDLYYRLRVVTLTLPPLRERREDIDIIAIYLLTRLSAEMSLDNPGITDESLNKLKRYDWPGNIRELSNSLKKALIFNRGAPIQPEDINLYSNHTAQPGGRQQSAAEADDILPWIRRILHSTEQERAFDYCLDRVAALLVKEALAISGGNRSRAAKLLGISRPTLHAKICKFALDTKSDDPC
ncbi:sigma-54-dependent transcriptional regulator [Desulforhopalus singaporensis]|uniref:DNA-binding transcriptional regulator NtrC n=1 Tax=Desulforhopalus singaporensis TaxID=91360 RepID=A0A1H0SSS5_9BACT|nr:sigma-54 dependent transcriptional regulator [Desulforhopalus singaporensis]SDP44832.1 two-component system, NtrC family, nitrogen regulation response regulator GlnG [Desulforhopalus singaporensis]